MKRLLSIICVVLALTIGLSLSVFAEPTDSFTHIDQENGTQVSVMAREMYKSTKVINGSSLGLDEPLTGLNDLCCDESGNVYLLATENSKIIVLDKNYKYKKTIILIDEDGMEASFSGAQGIYVDKNNDIFICDTRNAQILIADSKGKIKKTLLQPESSLIPEDFIYEPYRLVRDDKGYTYILSNSCYYGALSYSPEYEFLGFYGANTVTASALDTLSFLWDKLTQTDEKKASSVKSLPFSFVDLALDSEDYMVTCTGKTGEDDNGTGQIRKLSPGGGDILYKRSTDGSSESSTSLNFLENTVLKKNGAANTQNIVAVDTDDKDFIYALDQTCRLIYVYDSECNMLGGFGGGSDNSVQKGVFNKPVSLKLHGSDVLVIDYENCTLTVFEETEYGRALKTAQAAYVKGDYDQSDELWETVLSFDRSNQLAYRGLAMSALTNEDYDKALDFAKRGLDYTVYDMAWQKVVSSYINDNFIWIFGLVLLFIAGIIAFAVTVKKRQIVLVKSIKTKTMLSCVGHPFNSFADIKYKKYGSVLLATILLFVFYIGKVLESTASGFLFMKSNPRTYNMLYTVVGTIGIALLWSLANFLVACLANGKGTFKEVYISTIYSLLPLIVYTYIRLVCSWVVPLSGLAILDGVKVAVLIFTFFILTVGNMAIHEYDFFKFLTTAIVSILFMILIVFVMFLIGVLLQQIGTFFSSIYTELFFR